ncbi:MAG: hypothetical protein ABUL58_03395 [Steroidobacter sp.]
MVLIIPLLFGCQSTLPSTPEPGLSITELRPLLIANGFPSVWDKGYSLWKMNESQWDMAFFEEPISMQDRACYVWIHLVHLFRKQEGFVVERSDGSDEFRLSLTSCGTIHDPDHFRQVRYHEWRYGYPTPEVVNDVVTQLYSALVKSNNPKVVIDNMSPGLEEPFNKLKPQDFDDAQIGRDGTIYAHFFSKDLYKKDRYIGLAIKKPVDGITHIDVSWLQYQFLD